MILQERGVDYMKLEQVINLIPGTQTRIYILNNRAPNVILAILSSCRPRWAEAASLDNTQTYVIKSGTDFLSLDASCLSEFSCRVPSPDGFCARLTIDFKTDTLRVTCSPDAMDSIIDMIQDKKPVRRPRRAEAPVRLTVNA